MELLFLLSACGQSQSSDNSDTEKIVGGQPAAQGQYPWMAAMVNKGQQTNFCGGSIISNSYILTAAHCTA